MTQEDYCTHLAKLTEQVRRNLVATACHTAQASFLLILANLIDDAPLALLNNNQLISSARWLFSWTALLYLVSLLYPLVIFVFYHFSIRTLRKKYESQTQSVNNLVEDNAATKDNPPSHILNGRDVQRLRATRDELQRTSGFTDRMRAGILIAYTAGTSMLAYLGERLFWVPAAMMGALLLYALSRYILNFQAALRKNRLEQWDEILRRTEELATSGIPADQKALLKVALERELEAWFRRGLTAGE